MAIITNTTNTSNDMKSYWENYIFNAAPPITQGDIDRSNVAFSVITDNARKPVKPDSPLIDIIEDLVN